MKKLFFILFLTTSLANGQQKITNFIDIYLKNFIVAEKNGLSEPKEQISELKKREITSNFFFNNNYSSLNNKESSNILNDNVISDLNLFTTGQDGANLFAKINNTTTVFGEIHLINQLVSPTNNQEQLNINQHLLKKLVENKEALAILEVELKNIQQNQNAFLSLWEQDKESTENLFFKKFFLKKLNNNAYTASAANNILTFGQWIIAHCFELLPVGALNEYIIKDYTAANISKKTTSILKDFVKHNINPKNLWAPFSDIKQKYDTVDQNIKDIQKAYQENNIQISEKSNRILRGSALIGIGIGSLIQLYSLYLKINFYKKQVHRKAVVDSLQTKLCEISVILKSLDTINAVVENDLGISLPELQLTEEAKNLINDLHSSSFENPSLFYFEGRVLKCYHQIKKMKDQLSNLFVQIGYIDSYVSMAKLYTSNPDKPRFCFVEFLNEKNPIIIGKDFWNIFIDSNNVITNNLSIDKNIVLTGPNAGGKSTTIKAFLQNLLLAQTFGIAAACEFKCTPFSKISSYLNIADDLANGLSLFKAEVERAKTLLNTLNFLKENEFGFCAIDELFTGTASEDGQECAYELANNFGKKKNSIFVFATHYKKLTALERTSKNFANYKVGAPYKINGKFVYPFTIEKGINTINIAKDILREEKLI
ncbi:MAG: hypothetical protein WDZ41_05805 [Candidatus Babeliales bacterium]